MQNLQNLSRNRNLKNLQNRSRTRNLKNLRCILYCDLCWMWWIAYYVLILDITNLALCRPRMRIDDLCVRRIAPRREIVYYVFILDIIMWLTFCVMWWTVWRIYLCRPRMRIVYYELWWIYPVPTQEEDYHVTDILHHVIDRIEVWAVIRRIMVRSSKDANFLTKYTAG